MATISVINKSKLEGTSRIDSEFYKQEYLQLNELIKSNEWIKLKSGINDVKSFGAYALMNKVFYQRSGIPFLRAMNINDCEVDFAGVLFIDHEAHRLLYKSEVYSNQVLFSMSGTIGNAVVAASDWIYPINSSQDVAKITTNEKLNPYYLVAFLNSKYGLFQTHREAVGSVQQHIFLWQIQLLNIPLLRNIQDRIAAIVLNAEILNNKSRKLWADTEKKLLIELNLFNWQSTHKKTFVRNNSEVQSALRIDAEHYQPKYDEMIGKIPANVELIPLRKVATYKKGIEVGSDEYKEKGKPFWRVSNLTRYGLEKQNLNYISEPLYDELNSRYKPNKGELLLSKDATPGLAYYVNEEIEGIISSGILKLKLISDIPPYYLETVLNSVFVQMQ